MEKVRKSKFGALLEATKANKDLVSIEELTEAIGEELEFILSTLATMSCNQYGLTCVLQNLNERLHDIEEQEFWKKLEKEE